MNVLHLITVLTVLTFMAPPISFANNAMPWDAQEDEMAAREEMNADEKSAQEEMSSSIYGRITSIDLRRKVLSLLPTDEVENEEAEEDDEDTPEEYRFKSNTTVTGIDSLKELSPGDYVTLEYYEYEDRNEITEIVFDKHSEDEETTDENTATKTNEASSSVLVG